MNEKQLESVKVIFKLYPEIKVVYFFGSKAVGEDRPLSDYDFAVHLDEKNRRRMFAIKFELFDRLSRLLKTDKVDIVILNLTESPKLKYNIIKDGKVILDEEPFRILLEPKILNEYFDFHYMLTKYHLTQA